MVLPSLGTNTSRADIMVSVVVAVVMGNRIVHKTNRLVATYCDNSACDDHVTRCQLIITIITIRA